MRQHYKLRRTFPANAAHDVLKYTLDLLGLQVKKGCGASLELPYEHFSWQSDFVSDLCGTLKAPKQGWYFAVLNCNFVHASPCREVDKKLVRRKVNRSLMIAATYPEIQNLCELRKFQPRAVVSTPLAWFQRSQPWGRAIAGAALRIADSGA